MAKKQPDHDSNRTKIMFIVGIVAIVAILSANSNESNIGGEAVMAPDCEVEEYCKEWTWNDNVDLNCLNDKFVTYKECSSYSWPFDENGVPVMTCDSWNTVHKSECVEWEYNTDWEQECVEWSTKSSC